jgi:hypothetical protein
MGVCVKFFRVKGTDPKSEEEVYSHFSEIFDDEDVNFLAVEDFGDFDIMYTFLPNYKVNELKRVLDNYGLISEYIDLTDDIIKYDQETPEFKKTFSNDKNLEILKNFRKKNLTVDIVLDKINESGSSSLTDIDKEILSCFKN